MSGAYTAQVSGDLSLSSRFHFNVYSYESEWTVGAEWWIRRPYSDDITHQSLAGRTSDDDINGVIKARASTNNDVSLLWEGRIRNLLISLGVISDFSSRSKPIKAIGLELSYFSSD